MKNATMLLVVLTTMTLGACGGGDGGGRVSAFVGVWLPTGGTSTSMCEGQSSTDQVTETLTWAAGSSSDLVRTLGDSCVLRANIMSSTASLASPAICTFNGADSYGYAYTTTTSLTGYTFALGADGLTASENMSATIAFTAGGQTVNCAYTESASYQKQ
jgi:hypothetical protein